MDRRGPQLEPDEAPPTQGEARFDALLDERFAPAGREAFARELDAHDRRGALAEGLDLQRVRRGMRFRGAVPDRVRQLVTEWLPELMAHAAELGLELRDPYQECEVFARAAFEQEHGALPGGLKLPASSYQYLPVSRRYTVRLVLPEPLQGMEGLFTALRAVLTRLYGDIYLREEVYALEAYRADLERGDEAVTAGLAEQIAVLAELEHSTPELEAALQAYARNIGVNHQRYPEQARRAWCNEASAELERQRLAPERQRLAEGAFAAYLAALGADVAGGVGALVATVQEHDRQLRFLPPDEAPEYERLREQNPLHFLRSVKLRLEFLLEAFAGLLEDFDALAEPGAPYPALADARVAGTLLELERGGLARPYLVPGVRLSDDLERKRNGFPLEVHALMARAPSAEPAEKRFRTLSKRLESSLHQRLYNALVLMRHWMHLRDQGRDGPFDRSPQFQTLKGLVANFRYRMPLLHSLFLRIGVVLEVAEHAPEAPGGAGERRAFPVQEFSRAWGQFVAHALLADYLATQRRLQGFDAGRYWGQVDARLDAQVEAGQPGAQLMYLLRHVHAAADPREGLRLLGQVLRGSTPTFRFTVGQALRPRPPGKDGAAWRGQLDAWAMSVLESHRSSQRNAIVIDGSGGAG